VYNRLLERWRGAVVVRACIGVYTLLVGDRASLVYAVLIGGHSLLAGDVSKFYKHHFKRQFGPQYGLGQQFPISSPPRYKARRIRRRDVLGGIIHEYFCHPPNAIMPVDGIFTYCWLKWSSWTLHIR